VLGLAPLFNGQARRGVTAEQSVSRVAVTQFDFMYCWSHNEHVTTTIWEYNKIASYLTCTCITHVRNLLHVSSTFCGHLQGSVFTKNILQRCHNNVHIY